MGLARTQQVLARLYTEADPREQFFNDPQGTGEALGLNPEEAQQLAQLQQQVAFFATSLQSKRCNEVAKLLPLAHHALGERFHVLFREHAAVYVPQGTKKHLNDAAAFVAFVAHTSSISNVDPWIVDLARYESSWLRAATSSCWIAQRFRYPVAKLAHAVTCEEAVVQPMRQLTLGIWLRLYPQGRLRHYILPLSGHMPYKGQVAEHG